MVSDDHAKPDEDLPAGEPTEEPVELNTPASEETEESEQDRVAALVSQLEAEKRELKNQLLRALAEIENVRRRADREREDSAKYAVAPLAKDLLSVRDNLLRAIESVPGEAVEENAALKTLIEGVAMTERGLMDAFARHKIEAIDPVGEKLDPNLHHALFEVPDPSQPAGTVAQVIEVGYRLRDRLLREAKVGVYKGGPSLKAASASNAESAAEEAAPASDGEADATDGAAQPGQRVDTEV